MQEEKRVGRKLLILIVLAALIFLWLIKAPLLSSYLTNKLRVPVSIEKISIWPRVAIIRSFEVKNPDGFKNPIAFKARRAQIDYSFQELFGDPCIIDQILIDNIFLDIEFSNQDSNNWIAIGAHMPIQKSGQRVIIHKLILSHFTIEIFGFGKTIKKSVDRLEFDEVDSAKGFPTEEIIQKVFGGLEIEEFIKDAFNP